MTEGGARALAQGSLCFLVARMLAQYRPVHPEDQGTQPTLLPAWLAVCLALLGGKTRLSMSVSLPETSPSLPSGPVLTAQDGLTSHQFQTSRELAEKGKQ